MRVDCSVATEPVIALAPEPPTESLKELVKKASKKSTSPKADASLSQANEAVQEDKEMISMLVPASLGIDYEHELINGEKRKTHTLNVNGQKHKIVFGQLNRVPVWAEAVLANYIKSVAGLKVAR